MFYHAGETDKVVITIKKLKEKVKNVRNTTDKQELKEKCRDAMDKIEDTIDELVAHANS